ncbi:MAG: hypothetical protein R3D66_02990 [Alphaproteobacteria bacterium]
MIERPEIEGLTVKSEMTRALSMASLLMHGQWRCATLAFFNPNGRESEFARLRTDHIKNPAVTFADESEIFPALRKKLKKEYPGEYIHFVGEPLIAELPDKIVNYSVAVKNGSDTQTHMRLYGTYAKPYCRVATEDAQIGLSFSFNPIARNIQLFDAWLPGRNSEDRFDKTSVPCSKDFKDCFALPLMTLFDDLVNDRVDTDEKKAAWDDKVHQIQQAVWAMEDLSQSAPTLKQ